jgi:hypothetical protein
MSSKAKHLCIKILKCGPQHDINTRESRNNNERERFSHTTKTRDAQQIYD